MKHSKWLKFIEWFFRVFSWFMMLEILILLFALPVVIFTKEISPDISITSFYLSSITLFTAVVLMYLLYQSIWKLLNEILNSMEISNRLLQLINRLKYIFLISFFYDLLILITIYTNNFVSVRNSFVGEPNAKIDSIMEFLFPAIEFFFPTFGYGINTLFFFFLTLFIYKFLTNYKELKDSKERLEEEQRYTV